MPSYRPPTATTTSGAVNVNALLPLTGGNTSTSPFATSGATLTPHGPGNDLQGTTILPGQSSQTRTAGTMAMNAAQQVAGTQFSPFQTVGPFTSGATGQMAGIGATGYQQGGTTDPSAAYGFQSQAAAGLTGGSMGQGTAGLVGLGGYSAPSVTDGGPGGSYSFGGFGQDVGRARALTMQSLEQAMSGPERLQLAQEAYDQFAERSQPQFDMDQRRLSQRTAAMGRAGSGMVNSEFADLGTARERELSLARRELSTQAAGQTMADRIARTQLGQGVAEGFGGLDLAGEELKLGGARLAEDGAGRRMSASAANANAANSAAGIRLGANNSLIDAGQFGVNTLRGLGSDRFAMDSAITGERGADANRRLGTDQFNTGLRERQAQFGYDADMDTYASRVGERNAARGDEFNVFGANMDRFNQLGSFYNDRENRDAANREELRGERGFQTAQAQQAQNDDYRSAEFDEFLRNSRFGRAQGYAGLGYGANPSGAYGNAAQYYGNQAQGSMNSMGPMMQFLAQRGGAGNAPRTAQGV